MISTIIFDADGTLYNVSTEQAYEEMITTIASKTGKPEEIIRNHWHRHLEELKQSQDPADRHRATPIERALSDLGIGTLENGQITKEALEVFWDQVVADLTVDDALPDVFDTLEDIGIETMFVASEEFRIPLELKLREAEPYWDERFDEIITPETVNTMKPASTFITYILNQYDLQPEECMFVGDSWDRDLAPAAEAGVHTVMKTNSKDDRPDHCIKTLEELPAIIETYR